MAPGLRSVKHPRGAYGAEHSSEALLCEWHLPDGELASVSCLPVVTIIGLSSLPQGASGMARARGPGIGPLVTRGDDNRHNGQRCTGPWATSAGFHGRHNGKSRRL